MIIHSCFNFPVFWKSIQNLDLFHLFFHYFVLYSVPSIYLHHPVQVLKAPLLWAWWSEIRSRAYLCCSVKYYTSIWWPGSKMCVSVNVFTLETNYNENLQLSTYIFGTSEISYFSPSGYFPYCYITGLNTWCVEQVPFVNKSVS